ncbi:zinc piracy TonB-dependent receptor ZnuD [Acinetobacter sp. WZC-1]|uniref:zinc piracy TonB-dependent receptor ZnuD n=1 Tax=Acinetobacter sp. WZC-1 TaxID=3459034 RepID=UPI00403D598E
MSFTKSALTISILTIVSTAIWADDTPGAGDTGSVQQLSPIILRAHAPDQSREDLLDKQVVNSATLMKGGTTIGDAVNGLPGVYAGQYSGGVSHPVVRGQDGSRVKIVQNGADILDVSSLSPDHTVTVEPTSAEKVEVLQGPAALLYGAGSVGGLINVIDEKIPVRMPDQKVEGKIGTRYNSGSDELLSHAQVTAALGDQFALRLSGLKRDANDYIAPNYIENGESQRRVDSTFADSKDFDAGLSWIYDRGYTGISFSRRHDKYGIPADNELYGACELNSLRLDCPSATEGGDDAETVRDNTWINLKSKTYALKSELRDPFKGFSNLKVQASHTDYQHQEMDGDEADTTFKSKGTEARVELVHQPLANWTGTVGAQYTQQKLTIGGEEALMAPTDNKKYSLFALEHRQLGDDWHLELGGRLDHQKTEIDSDQKNYDGTAFSASAAATWNFIPDYNLTLTASHQERLPMAQELYSNGKHMATNTYELGDDSLDKEKSNNLELGLHYDHDKLNYQAHIFHSWFDNFVYARTLDQFQDFRLIQYSQDHARFYGADASVSYQLSPIYTATLFGDYVRAKLDDEGNAPRIPGGRAGARVNAEFGNGYSGLAEYYHVFNQDDIAHYETETPGYNMLNLGLAYSGKWSKAEDYKLYAKANNLLDDAVYQHESFIAAVPQVGRNFTVGLEVGF